MERNFSVHKNEVWFLGLASIFCWGIVLILHFLSSQFNWAAVAMTAVKTIFPVLLIATSYPHLLISFKYGYGQGSKFIFNNWFYLVAAPIALVSLYIFAAAVWDESASANHGATALSLIFNAFILGSGWHAMRQVYGISLMYSNYKRFTFTPWQKKLLLANLYSVFLIDFVNLNLTAGTFNLFGFPFTPLGFTLPVLHLTFILCAASGSALLISLYSNPAGNLKKWPPAEACIAIAAIYVWALPCFFVPVFTIFAPNTFHSIQYFTILFRAEKPAAGSHLKYWFKQWAFWTAAGVFLIKFLPEQLDKILPAQTASQAGFFAFCFFTFANLQHYFIDSCIWKSASGSYLPKNLQGHALDQSNEVTGSDLSPLDNVG